MCDGKTPDSVRQQGGEQVVGCTNRNEFNSTATRTGLECFRSHVGGLCLIERRLLQVHNNAVMRPLLPWLRYEQVPVP